MYSLAFIEEGTKKASLSAAAVGSSCLLVREEPFVMSQRLFLKKPPIADIFSNLTGFPTPVIVSKREILIPIEKEVQKYEPQVERISVRETNR